MNYLIVTMILISFSFLVNVFFVILRVYEVNKYSFNQTEDIKKSINYFKDKQNQFLIEIIVNYMALMIVLITNSLYHLFAWLLSLNLDIIYAEVITLMIVSFLLYIIYFIFSYIRTFKIEEKYGFNKETFKSFLKDKIIVLIVLNIFIFGIVYLINNESNVEFDLLRTVITYGLFIIMILIMFFIKRLFNKFKPIPEGSLKTLIEDFANKHNFKFKNVYIMDASRRTTKSNAYFQGFGRFRKIVLYDNLLHQFSDEEILAIFAHEVGHAKHRDNLKLFLIIIPIVVGLLYLFEYMHINYNFYASFKFVEPNTSLTIFIAYALSGFINFLFKLIRNPISRKMEYKADRFEALNVNKDAAISVLKKLETTNLSNLNPHPLDVFVNYSHPTIKQRIKAIKEI